MEYVSGGNSLNLAKLDSGLNESPTVMVGETKTILAKNIHQTCSPNIAKAPTNSTILVVSSLSSII